MLYLIGAGLLFIISIILLILARKKEKLTIQQAVEKHEKYIDELTQQKQEEYEQLIQYQVKLSQDCQTLEKQRLYEQDRAREAHDATERLLLAEQERARANLDGIKQLEEERLKNEFKAREATLEQQYQFKQTQFEEDFQALNDALQDELKIVKAELDDFQARREAVNEAIRREKEIEEKEDFYSIDVPQADQEDIRVLQDMDLKLHNRDVIPKLIWELFVRRPCQEMIKRVTGGRKISGIYKITNKKTGEAYVGKTTDISTRWQNHCKTAVGLEGAARTTLHNRLAKDGLWAYTWEILEQVDKDHLSAREAFYINLYDTTKQLNMKEGSKNGTQ